MLNVPDEIFEKMCYDNFFDIIKKYKIFGETDVSFYELKNLNFDISRKFNIYDIFKEDFNDFKGINDYDFLLTQINTLPDITTEENILTNLNIPNTKFSSFLQELSMNIITYSNITFNGEDIIPSELLLLERSQGMTIIEALIINLNEKLYNIYDNSKNDYNYIFFKILYSMGGPLTKNFYKSIIPIFKLFNTNNGECTVEIENSPFIYFSPRISFLEDALTTQIFNDKKNEYIKKLTYLFGIDEGKMSNLFLKKPTLDILFIPETNNITISETRSVSSVCILNKDDSNNTDKLKETIFMAEILVIQHYDFNENTLTIDIKLRWVIDDEDITKLINYYSKIFDEGQKNNFNNVNYCPNVDYNVDLGKTIFLLIKLYLCMLKNKKDYKFENNLKYYLDEKLPGEVQTFSNETCDEFYDELKVNNNIIPKNNFNFDFIQGISISDWVDEKLEKLYTINDFINFDGFINNNNKYFELNDFKKPIFDLLFNILASEITKYNLYLNDTHILKYDQDVATGNKINISDNNWAIKNFIPCLFEIYETSCKQMFSPKEFNLKFFELLYSFSLFTDINAVFNDIITTFNEYNIVSTRLIKTSYQGLITQSESYVTKYAKKLSMLFDMPEDKIKESILNFGTVIINLNFENIIITNTSTIILTYNENKEFLLVDDLVRTDFNINNIIGIILIQNNYNLLTNENQTIFECRWYIPDNSTKIYKNAINDNKINFLNCLQYTQDKKSSENNMILQKTKTVCDNTLNLLIDEIKNHRLILEILSTSNTNEIKFIKYSKLNFDVIFELGLHEYYKNLYFKKINGDQQDYDDYVLSISSSCLDENYLLEIYNKDKNNKSKIYRCFDSIGRDINSYDEIIVNDTIIFNKNSKNINGDIINRLNGFEYLVKEFLPNLLNIYKANYKSTDCTKFNEGYITLIFSLVLSDVPSFLLFSIQESLINHNENPFNIVNMNFLMLNELVLENNMYVDLTNIDINTLAKTFDTSLEYIKNIYLFNKLKINITEDNVIIKKTTSYGIFFIDPSGLLGILLVTEMYNFKNNTYNITCQMRWLPNNSLIKQNITLIKNAYDELNDNEKQEKQEKLNEILSYYRCVYLNGLSPEEIQNINSDSDDSIEWPEIKLNTFEKITQKWNILKDKHPKKIVAGITSGVGLATTGISLASVLGGNKTKTKRNIKRINKKRVTRNYMKKNTQKKTRKGVKKVKKTRNTKRQKNPNK